MNIRKDKGLIYSEYILHKLSYELSENKEINCSVEAFYNCREIGYLLRFYNEDYSKVLCMWVYGHRNSDEPTITYEEIEYPKDPGNMFSQDGWENNTYTYETIEQTTEKAIEIIESIFKEEE